MSWEYAILRENPLQFLGLNIQFSVRLKREKSVRMEGKGVRVRRPATLICPDTFRIATHSQDLISSSKSPLR